MPQTLIPAERIESKIYFIHGRKVMLDRELAELYGVPTKVFNQAVRRNMARFPHDFMFQLSKDESQNLRSQTVTSSGNWGGTRYCPYVFTEHGVAMLSSVLKSEQAIAVNIQIVRTFTKLREMLAENDYLRLRIEAMEKQYDEHFKIVFDAIRGLLKEKDEPREEIGFKDGRKNSASPQP